MDKRPGLWKFIKTRTFLLNILGAGAFYVSFSFLFAFGIKAYTRHGSEINVPNLKGLSVNEASKKINKADLQLKIVDSVYDSRKPSFLVIDQKPAPNSKVKESRTIYITVNAKTPPQIRMPDLKDASLKQATMILESYGMTVGKLVYKPDLAGNVVLEQMYNGKPIASGELVKKGATIDLVIGDGMGETSVEVPNLVGLSLREAEFVVKGSSLNIGSIITDNTINGDTLDAIVYQQSPPADESAKITLKGGDKIDVFVTSLSHFKKDQ
ncbi:MAG: PASTA domain-containing protein [Chitinophagales bacterium]|nr:PASTA domain-containing protein [Chitinophagales bacterium]